MVYAVIESGGRQYKVAPGEVIEVNRLPAEVGETVELDNVLMIGGEEGKCVVGQPTVSGAVVRARVAGHPRSRKIIVFKYKPKVRYRRMRSHRQDLTRLVINEIVSGAQALERHQGEPGQIESTESTDEPVSAAIAPEAPHPNQGGSNGT